MQTPNSSTKKKRKPVVQVVMTAELHEQFLTHCENQSRSESAMGSILIAKALNDDAAQASSSVNSSRS